MGAEVILDPRESAFLDTSLVVAATVEVHPSHAAATRVVDAIVTQGYALCISPQICREFMVVLTRQPVSGRVFSVEEALAALSVWTTGCALLEETESVHQEWLDLVKRHGVHGKQVHDCNIVATMKAHGIRRLITRNPADFKRYHQEILVEPVPD